jgi:glycosyltransferase involved in cell wall biosynthesis
MKVLMVEFWGSYNRYSFNLAHALSKLNAEITLVSVEDCMQGFSTPYTLLNILPSSDNSQLVKLYKYLKAYLFVIKVAKKSNIKIIHIQYFMVLPVACLFFIILRFFGFRIVYTAHNVLPHERKGYHKYLFRAIYHLFHLIIITSESARDQIESELAVRPTKITVIPIGHSGPPAIAGLSRKKARKVLKIPLQTNLVLSFGIIREYKGIDTLIKAIHIAKDRIQNLRMLIVGSCWNNRLLNSYASLIDELRLQDIVKMRIGFVSEKDMALYMAASDIIVLPYKGASGHSGVLLTAYCFGRPVIASEIGGLREAVEDGKSGFLTPPDDEIKLADAIIKAFADPEKLIRMGRYAKEINQKKYSWDEIAKVTIQAYRDLLLKRFNQT